MDERSISHCYVMEFPLRILENMKFAQLVEFTSVIRVRVHAPGAASGYVWTKQWEITHPTVSSELRVRAPEVSMYQPF